ncbi:MAG: sugar phosphate nucleotidyltransferase, partial [Dehalococcoidia bacterium]|nr:sugar phosphate nucleotidyltransferase [Dehalococcoidia bacterium]
MQAVILTAGEGRRMLPLSKSRPKGMLPIANKPIIEHILTESKNAGIYDLVLVISSKDNATPRYFGNGERFGVKISYCRQCDIPGTGAALQAARDAVQQNFLVFNGDLLISAVDILQLAQADCIAIGAKELANPVDKGIIEEHNGQVRRIIEKPAVTSSSPVNIGAYLLNEHVFGAIENTALSPRGEIELTQALQLLLNQGISVHCVKLKSWQDISYPWDLLDANAQLLSQQTSANQGIIEDNVHIDGACRIGAGSIIRSGSYIAGPVAIGDHCDIGPHCFIRSATSIGNNCRIGAGVEIKNSIVMQGTKIPHITYIGDSVIGENCNIGAGTKIANTRFD